MAVPHRQYKHTKRRNMYTYLIIFVKNMFQGILFFHCRIFQKNKFVYFKGKINRLFVHNSLEFSPLVLENLVLAYIVNIMNIFLIFFSSVDLLHILQQIIHMFLILTHNYNIVNTYATGSILISLHLHYRLFWVNKK